MINSSFHPQGGSNPHSKVHPNKFHSKTHHQTKNSFTSTNEQIHNHKSEVGFVTSGYGQRFLPHRGRPPILPTGFLGGQSKSKAQECYFWKSEFYFPLGAWVRNLNETHMEVCSSKTGRAVGEIPHLTILRYTLLYLIKRLMVVVWQLLVWTQTNGLLPSTLCVLKASGLPPHELALDWHWIRREPWNWGGRGEFATPLDLEKGFFKGHQKNLMLESGVDSRTLAVFGDGFSNGICSDGLSSGDLIHPADERSYWSWRIERFLLFFENFWLWLTGISLISGCQLEFGWVWSEALVFVLRYGLRFEKFVWHFDWFSWFCFATSFPFLSYLSMRILWNFGANFGL